MACSVCGKDGHNARTCQEDSRAVEVAAPNQALWIKYDNITLQQADKLLQSAISSKTKIAPEGRATFAKGTTSELPKKISEALALPHEGGLSDQKKIK